MVNRWETSREKSMDKNQMKNGELKNTSEIKRNSWVAGFEQFGVSKQIRESEVRSIETSLKSRKKRLNTTEAVT